MHRVLLAGEQGSEWPGREPTSSSLQPNQAQPHKSTPPPAATTMLAIHCVCRFNSSSPASFHFLATPPHLLSPHNFIEGAVRKPRPEQSCTQSGQRRVTARSALSELCPTYDPPMVPPGAERAARGVPSELRLNLELNIGPLPHPWPFAPRFLRAKSRTQTKCLHLTC